MKEEMKNKVLLIPDIHGRDFWKKACNEWKGEIIFLGDFFDPYPQEGIENPLDNALEAIDFIYNNKDRCTVMLANHDGHYILPDFVQSSRYSYGNAELYKEQLKRIEDVTKGALIKGDIIFSHAGITEIWAENFLADYMEYHNMNDVNDVVLETAEILQDTRISDYNDSYIQALSMIGPARGGYNSCGSCVWADISEHFTRKLSGFSPKQYSKFQVFGHTQLKHELIQEHWACLDCRKSFIVNTDTKEIKEYV